MNKQIVWLAICSLLVFTGCVETQPFQPIYSHPEFIGFNEAEIQEHFEKKDLKNYVLGQNKNCYVGDEMIHFASYNKKIKEKVGTIQYKAIQDNLHIKNGLVYDVKGKSFSNSNYLYLQLFESNGNFRFLKINTDGYLVSADLFDWNGNVWQKDFINNINTKIFERVENGTEREEIYLKGSFSYSILYNGKDGNGIKLQYREYKDDMARVAFYQDLTYDLKESKIIRFRNFKLEILKATNEGIEYKVLQD